MNGIDSMVLSSHILDRIDVFSNIFFSICGLILLFTGYLTWNHNKQKEEAVRQLKRMSKIINETNKLKVSFDRLMNESRLNLEESKRMLSKLTVDAKDVSDAITESKKMGKVTKDLDDKVKQLSSNIENSLRSVSGASGYVPFISGNLRSGASGYSGSMGGGYGGTGYFGGSANFYDGGGSGTLSGYSNRSTSSGTETTRLRSRKK